MMNSGRAREAVPDRAEQRGAAERAPREAGEHRAEDRAVVAHAGGVHGLQHGQPRRVDRVRDDDQDDDRPHQRGA